MNDRTDRKLREVAVGRYRYRYEAEFAAGFLDDARIPYRLQIDDPSLGMPLSGSATIWVHAMDKGRAQEILDTDESGETVRSYDAGEGRDVDHEAHDVAALRGATLGARQRTIALAAGIGLLGLVRYGAVDGSVTIVGSTVTAALLCLVAIVGKAPRLLQRLLSSLSGDAP